MKWFQKKEAAAVRSQLRGGARHPFTALDGYTPLGGGETRLYRAIREAVPVVDAAILKLIRLTGGVSVRCGDGKAQRELEDFLRTVNTGRGCRGIDSFLDAYLDSMITCGRAVGEIVTGGNRDIAALICGNVADVCVREGKTPLDFSICLNSGLEPQPLPYQELLLFTPFSPEADSPYGCSMLRSMPFLTDILMKIFTAMGSNWERCGNVRYAVVCRPGTESGMSASERAEAVAREWSSAMQETRGGSVRDFVAVGDVDIRVIGADNQILDSEVPVRQILEQLIARTGIPPFMLGLNWSSTERMSAQQADLMTSEITAIRRSLEPVLRRICSLWLRMHGYDCGFELVWDNVNLQDEVELARAALYGAQAQRALAGIKEAER
ncbi:MAG: serine/threonine protein phosphatase [Candidatus Heteroscillospira sp.]